MATDVSKRPQIAGDWKVKVIAGLVLFLAGMVGLYGALPLGDLSVQWTTSTALVVVGLSLVMFGLATITD